jgi:hypothetical protein
VSQRVTGDAGLTKSREARYSLIPEKCGISLLYTALQLRVPNLILNWQRAHGGRPATVVTDHLFTSSFECPLRYRTNEHPQSWKTRWRPKGITVADFGTPATLGCRQEEMASQSSTNYERSYGNERKLR